MNFQSEFIFKIYPNIFTKISQFSKSRGVIECNEPIEVVSYKIGVCKVSPKGKECTTTFQKLGYNGSSSVVLCKPRTGRMHQIRVHLQYLGEFYDYFLGVFFFIACIFIKIKLRILKTTIKISFFNTQSSTFQVLIFQKKKIS